MTQTEHIESAIRELPENEKKALVLRLSDVYWDAWDDQIKTDVQNGALDKLIGEAETDITTRSIKPLREVIDDQ